MRVNVYNEEFPSEVALIERPETLQSSGRIGVRFYLADPQKLTKSQDIREHKTAVTFWLKDRKDKSPMSDSEKFCNILYNAAKLLEERQREQK
jgi:hypothetical protein